MISDTRKTPFPWFGWTEVDWYTAGHLRGGYGDDAHQDRLYLSPHCLQPDGAEHEQPALWGDA